MASVRVLETEDGGEAGLLSDEVPLGAQDFLDAAVGGRGFVREVRELPGVVAHRSELALEVGRPDALSRFRKGVSP